LSQYLPPLWVRYEPHWGSFIDAMHTDEQRPIQLAPVFIKTPSKISFPSPKDCNPISTSAPYTSGGQSIWCEYSGISESHTRPNTAGENVLRQIVSTSHTLFSIQRSRRRQQKRRLRACLAVLQAWVSLLQSPLQPPKQNVEVVARGHLNEARGRFRDAGPLNLKPSLLLDAKFWLRKKRKRVVRGNIRSTLRREHRIQPVPCLAPNTHDSVKEFQIDFTVIFYSHLLRELPLV